MESVDVKKPFGTSVRTWRGRLGLSQEELAGRAGLHRTYICDVERGARNVSLQSIARLAAALEIPVSRLLSYDRDDSAPPARGGLPDEMVDILFVEDHPRDVELTLEALKNISNRIYVVKDGVAALDFLFCTGEYAHRQAADRPQLILLDLGLPKVGGLEVLRRVKEEPKTANIPVIVLTSSSSDLDIATSRQLGAEDYIIKPVDFRNLSEVTSKLSLQWALLKPATGATSETTLGRP